jgi:hypothetical protein
MTDPEFPDPGGAKKPMDPADLEQGQMYRFITKSLTVSVWSPLAEVSEQGENFPEWQL